jgi:hypothetical protein
MRSILILLILSLLTCYVFTCDHFKLEGYYYKQKNGLLERSKRKFGKKYAVKYIIAYRERDEGITYALFKKKGDVLEVEEEDGPLISKIPECVYLSDPDVFNEVFAVTNVGQKTAEQLLEEVMRKNDEKKKPTTKLKHR